MADQQTVTLPRCPHIGPFGFCEKTSCNHIIGGYCEWLAQNIQIRYTYGTEEEQRNG